MASGFRRKDRIISAAADALTLALEQCRREDASGGTAFAALSGYYAYTAAGDLRELVGQGVRIATVAGRYYAMDRDGRWDRTDRALRAIVHGEGPQIADPVAAVEAGYGRARAQTIRDCCSTRLTLGGGLDPATAQWFATLSGEATVVDAVLPSIVRSKV